MIGALCSAPSYRLSRVAPISSREDHPKSSGFTTARNGQTFGVSYDGKRFLSGALIHDVGSASTLEWRNELFERVDVRTRKRSTEAQQHRRP